MKYLGIDYGTKRVGIATSDDDGVLAFPKETFIHDESLIREIQNTIEKERVGELVVGAGENLDGGDNVVTEKIKFFVASLEAATNLPVHFEKEFFTSAEAHGREGKERNNARKESFNKPKDLDASAAALILQRYLDKVNKKASMEL